MELDPKGDCTMYSDDCTTKFIRLMEEKSVKCNVK